MKKSAVAAVAFALVIGAALVGTCFSVFHGEVVAEKYLEQPEDGCEPHLWQWRYNAATKEAVLLVHGGAMGGVWTGSTGEKSLPGGLTLKGAKTVSITEAVDQLAGELGGVQVNHVTVVCCYPGFQEPGYSQALGCSVTAVCDSKLPIGCLVNKEGVLVVNRHPIDETILAIEKAKMARSVRAWLFSHGIGR